MKKDVTCAMVGGAKEKNANNVMKVVAITAIAAMNPAGFTVDAKTLKPMVSGFSVGVFATQNSFGTEGLERVINYTAEHPEINAIGGWLNSDTGLYHYDAAIIVHTIEEAYALSMRENQIAFFDLNEMKEYRL